MFKQTTLPGGLRVLTESMPSMRSASIGIWADVGSSIERREQRGISHLVEHMLFKGTQRRSAREIAETGVNYLAVGALTHSSAVLDLGLDYLGAEG